MMLLPVPFCAAPEEMLTMTPSPVARSNGTKARIVANGPRTLAISAAARSAPLFVADDDARSRAGEKPHARGTDAAAAAGHHRDFAGKRKGVLGRHQHLVSQDPAISARRGLKRSAASYCTQCPAPAITSKRAPGWKLRSTRARSSRWG